MHSWWWAIGLTAFYVICGGGGAMLAARKGRFNVPHNYDDPNVRNQYRVAIEYRKRPWRSWAYTVEHSTQRGSWWVWKQGYASTYAAARRKARRGLTPPYGTPEREEWIVVKTLPEPRAKRPRWGTREPLVPATIDAEKLTPFATAAQTDGALHGTQGKDQR